jgi:hypothetical protein
MILSTTAFGSEAVAGEAETGKGMQRDENFGNGVSGLLDDGEGKGEMRDSRA